MSLSHNQDVRRVREGLEKGTRITNGQKDSLVGSSRKEREVAQSQGDVGPG